MQLYMSWYIRSFFRFYLLKYSLFFSSTLVLISSIDVVFILSIMMSWSFLQGERGDHGFNGAPGSPGPAGRGGGPSGMTGATGPSGPSGVPGNQGATGPAGKDATPPPGFVMQQGQRRRNPNNAALGKCVSEPKGEISLIPDGWFSFISVPVIQLPIYVITSLPLIWLPVVSFIINTV